MYGDDWKVDGVDSSMVDDFGYLWYVRPHFLMFVKSRDRERMAFAVKFWTGQGFPVYGTTKWYDMEHKGVLEWIRRNTPDIKVPKWAVARLHRA